MLQEFASARFAHDNLFCARQMFTLFLRVCALHINGKKLQCSVVQRNVARGNRFLVGLNGAGVLYYFFVQKMALLVGALNILLSGIWSL